MAQYHDPYGPNPTRTDEYGNPIRPTDDVARPVRQTDEYGNPVHHTGTMGDYGTTGVGTHGTGPVMTGTTGAHGHHGGTGVGTHGTDTVMTGTTGAHGHHGGIGTGHPEGKGHHGLGEKLHRSGSSSSSSSSEDDGFGGRRKKKGFTEKIKEKIPGTGHKDQTHESAVPTTTTPGVPTAVPTTTTTTPGVHGYGTTGEHHEKKGVMEKIKEKLPGGHNH